MDNDPNTSPTLEAGNVSASDLQAAVDGIGLDKIDGELRPGGEGTVVVLGIDVVPGLVLRRAEGNYEAPGVVYIESSGGNSKSSQSRRATILFHVSDAGGIEVDQVALAS
ncbi:hypothetical protein [Phenylobacterium sp.]|uniref:hypothetical protein n=1 Tax=Phenylobacterium sp. TaxID=1871053 RepID=UPI002C5A9709|nr:hypothetical protein [Phenylobacterium sp.]HLZ73686.1 hypothetical protein [Phenylobacterium sp.]